MKSRCVTSTPRFLYYEFQPFFCPSSEINCILSPAVVAALVRVPAVIVVVVVVTACAVVLVVLKSELCNAGVHTATNM